MYALSWLMFCLSILYLWDSSMFLHIDVVFLFPPSFHCWVMFHRRTILYPFYCWWIFRLFWVSILYIMLTFLYIFPGAHVQTFLGGCSPKSRITWLWWLCMLILGDTAKTFSKVAFTNHTSTNTCAFLFFPL